MSRCCICIQYPNTSYCSCTSSVLPDGDVPGVLMIISGTSRLPGTMHHIDVLSMICLVSHLMSHFLFTPFCCINHDELDSIRC